MRMVVTLDKQTGDLVLTLPEGYENYAKELKQALYSEFAFEPLNNMVLSRMNQFVDEWFSHRGIQLNPEDTE